ncbi:MAG TPA: hypothetical protein PKV71_09070 [Calditrichia bacterium]|nr:hypothetical protein [Calditrichia bacterium]
MGTKAQQESEHLPAYQGNLLIPFRVLGGISGCPEHHPGLKHQERESPGQNDHTDFDILREFAFEPCYQLKFFNGEKVFG